MMHIWNNDMPYIARREYKRVVYVSCDPAALARIVKISTGKEYAIEGAVQPVDKLPQPGHVGFVIGMQRKST